MIFYISPSSCKYKPPLHELEPQFLPNHGHYLLAGWGRGFPGLHFCLRPARMCPGPLPFVPGTVVDAGHGHLPR